MTTNPETNPLGRFIAIICGLLGLLFVSSAVQVHIDGVRTNRLDYQHNLPMIVLSSVGLLVVAGALFFLARTFWRAPRWSHRVGFSITTGEARAGAPEYYLKRPRGLYFVAAWCGFWLLGQTYPLTRLSRASEPFGGFESQLWAVLSAVAAGCVVWQTVGLLKLKRCHRWFAVVFLCWWSAVMIWNVACVPGRAATLSRVGWVIIGTLVSVNLLSVRYLTRRNFREMAVRFVAERRKD